VFCLRDEILLTGCWGVVGQWTRCAAGCGDLMSLLGWSMIVERA